MIRHTSHMGSMVLGVFLLAAPLCAEEQPVLKTRTDKDSYMTGIDIVQGLKKRGGQIDLDIVIRGMKDGLTGENMLMSEDDIRKYLAARDREGAQKQASSVHDTTNPVSAGGDRNSEPAGPQMKVNPERPDDPVPSSAAFAKKEGQAQAQQTGKVGAMSGQFVPYTQSLAQRGQNRNSLKLRGLELRRKAIEQGL